MVVGRLLNILQYPCQDPGSTGQEPDMKSGWKILTLIEEGQPLIGGTLVANIIEFGALLGPETGLVLRTRTLPAHLVPFPFADAEDTAIGRHRGVTFTLLGGDTTATAAGAVAPLAPIAPAPVDGGQLLPADALAVLTPLVPAAGGARGGGSHMGDALPVDPTPQRRAELVGGGTGAHLAVVGQVELQPALAPGIVPGAGQLVRIVVLVQRRGRIVQALAQSLAKMTTSGGLNNGGGGGGG